MPKQGRTPGTRAPRAANGCAQILLFHVSSLFTWKSFFNKKDLRSTTTCFSHSSMNNKLPSIRPVTITTLCQQSREELLVTSEGKSTGIKVQAPYYGAGFTLRFKLVLIESTLLLLSEASCF
jgi:hypothetical protein